MWVFSNDPFGQGEDVPGHIEDIVRIFEDFLGVPIPTTNIILLAIARPDDYPGFGGNHNGRRMQLKKYGPHNIGALPHETAHYCFSERPLWILEGGADFMAAIVFDRMGHVELDLHRAHAVLDTQSCMEWGGFENISHITYVYEVSWEWHLPSGHIRDCFYPWVETSSIASMRPLAKRRRHRL